MWVIYMLRIILDAKNIANEENIHGVNVQRTSFANIFSDEKNISRFQKYLEKCLDDNDQVIIVTFIDGLYDFAAINTKHDNLRILKLILTEKSSKFVVNQVVNYQNESLDLIQTKVEEIEEVFSLCFLTLMGY